MKQGDHGGNIFEAAGFLGVAPDEILDYSSNVSPWPADVFEGADTAKIFSRLPEPESETLRDAFAEKYGLRRRSVCITSGTTEAIEIICRIFTGKRALILSPTYSDYGRLCHRYNISTELLFTKPENGFKPVPRLFRTDADICFICNPNNPTGVLMDKPALIDIIKTNHNTFFVIDESYMPFAPDELRQTMLKEQLGNMAVLRSFSKIFGLPGLRLGAVITPGEEQSKRISSQLLPWNVNSAAQYAGEKLLKKDTTLAAGKLRMIKEKFLKELEGLEIVKPMESDVNYVLCRLNGMSSAELFEKCLRRKMLIRDCSNFVGLSGSWVRIAMGDRMEPIINFLKGI